MAVASSSLFPKSPLLGLPNELKLRICKELIAITNRSDALFGLHWTCRALRLLLSKTPDLWTYILIDHTTFNMRAARPVRTKRGAIRYNLWPGVRTILRLAGSRPISLALCFEGQTPNQCYVLGRVIHPGHLHTLMWILHERGFGRVRQLTIRCSLWSHTDAILAFLSRRTVIFPMLERIDVTCTAAGPEFDAIPFKQLNGVENPLFAPLHSSLTLGQYSITRFPSLKSVLLDSIPIRPSSFIPSQLAVLSLKGAIEPGYQGFVAVLMANEKTLHTLELFPDFFPYSGQKEAITLPNVYTLSLGVFDPMHITCLAKQLNLPSLKSLSIEDKWNSAGVFQTNYKHSGTPDDIRRDFMKMYETMIKRWPLAQVTYLKIVHGIFYETRENLAYLLGKSRKERVDWAPVPIASMFFTEFRSLETFVTWYPNRSLVRVLFNRPYQYDEVKGTFDVIHPPRFPALRRWLANGHIICGCLVWREDGKKQLGEAIRKMKNAPARNETGERHVVCVEGCSTSTAIRK
ncbi:hypothetical protein AAF712_010979 [Marasmius tenuissimus]|uniref:F-box domain-containing protein n=1 Tax=Marasmius tenuissimus TaxID=585030 RepID=A0ABR2ZLT6_9AGAR